MPYFGVGFFLWGARDLGCYLGCAKFSGVREVLGFMLVVLSLVECARSWGLCLLC